MDSEVDDMEQLRDEEIPDYIAECISVLKVMNDQGSPAYTKVMSSFIADIDRLLELGKITPDEYNEITNEDNFSF